MENQSKARAESVEARIAGLSPERRAVLARALMRKGLVQAEIPRRPPSDTAPVSHGQWRMWVLDQLAPGSSFYNESTTMPISFAVDVRLLERCVNEIVRRHESLRTTFQSVEGQLVQKIAPSLVVPVPVEDLSEVHWLEREREVQRVVREEARQPFDLARGPLIRTRLLRLDEQDHLFVVTMHHIICDGWSVGVFAWELTTFYQAASRGLPLIADELPIQYADFAIWQHRLLQGDGLGSHLSYWKAQLADLTTLQLPTDRPRPSVQTFDGAREPVVIPESLCSELNHVCQREGATLFMGLLAAFQTLLHRYTAQHDIAIGTPVANRNRHETEGLIGFFINTLVIRIDASGDPSFREFLRRVKDVVLDAFAHEDVPFEKLVEELQLQRDLSRNPLFQVSFQVFNAPSATYVPPTQIPPLRTVDKGSAKLDLQFDLMQAAHGLQGYLEYNTNLFDASTIAAMAAHLTTLLKAIVAAPESRLSELPVMTPTERKQLLETWNQTDEEYPRDTCVHQVFTALARRMPDALALESRHAQLAYGELNRRANQLAHYLVQHGVGREVLAAVCLDRSIEMVVAILGILKAGGAYVPLDPSNPTERLRFMAQDAEARVVVTRQAFKDRFLGTSTRIVCLDSDWTTIAETSDADPHSEVTPNDLAYVIYTSGSTGQPKGVEIRHQSLMNLVSWHQRAYGVTPADRASQVAAPAFDAAVWEIWPYLASGASVHIADEEILTHPAGMIDWLAARAITICFLPTLLAEAVLERSWSRQSRLRALLTGGDALRRVPPTPLPFALQNHYGPTENTVVTTWATLGASPQTASAPTIGRPISNVRVYVLDRDLQPVPIGVHGELCISGEGLSRGYRSRPELTAEKFLVNPFSDDGSRLYRTGDLVRYRRDGDLEFLGRIDQQVKIRGYRIELGEIETVLQQAPGVKRCVALAREDGSGVKHVIAYVELEEQTVPDTAALRRHLQEHLPDYLIPSAFVVMDTFPVTPNGKIDRRALPTPEALEQKRLKEHVPPRTPLERVLANIWSSVLQTDNVGVHDNFFELGGHSLLATQVVSRLRDTFQLELPLRSVFESFTIAELAETLLRDPATRSRVERTAQLLLTVSELSEAEAQAQLAQRSSRIDA